MTEAEIRQLYALVMSYDNRKFSEANITAWWQQAERNRWEFDEARQAIHQHHAESTEFLMPAHVTAIIKARRSQPQRIDETRQIEAPPPAHPERIRSVVDELGKRLGWESRAPLAEDAATLAVECPFCHAQPKRPCTMQITRGTHRGEYRPLSTFHASRIDLAAAAAEHESTA